MQRIGFISLMTLCLSLASGQERDAYVRTELLALSIANPVEELYYRSGNNVEVFRSGGVGLGQPMPYSGSAVLRLYRKRSEVPSAEAEANPLFRGPEPAATVRLPPDQNRILLLCHQTKDSTLRLMAVPASFEDLHTGDYKVFNFSGQPIAMRLGEQTLRLAPKESRSLANQKWRQQTMNLEVMIGIKTESGPRSVFSTVWGHDPACRYFVFLLDGFHASTPIRTIKVNDRHSPAPGP